MASRKQPSFTDLNNHLGRLKQLYPAAVAVTTATPEMWSTPVLPEEEIYIKQSVEKRRREFRAGRHCAHLALSTLGMEIQPVTITAARLPNWPDGVIGSISHCRDACVAVASKDPCHIGIGIDIEPTGMLNPGVAERVMSKRELSFFSDHPELPDKLAFCAKECLFKCYNPIIGRYFGLKSVELTFDHSSKQFHFTGLDETAPEHQALGLFEGRFELLEGHIVCGAVLRKS